MTEKPHPVEVDDETEGTVPPVSPGPPHGDPLAPRETEGTVPSVSADEADAGSDPPVAAEPDWKDKYVRAMAELDNVRKRSARDVAAASERGVARLAKELLTALDHLEIALQQAEQHDAGEWLKGIRLVQDEFLTALGRVGIQPFAPLGEPFDPNEHEAMAQQPSEDAEPGTVLQVYQQGYRLNGQVLRPARVVVSGGAA